ncbi:MAG: hypothetical protein H0V31_10530 [Acidobacteria bacterium]|nr:hypothetical protein [Acidobacteriota bacterium]
MVRKILSAIINAYDGLFNWWESLPVQRWKANLLVAAFLVSLCVIEAARQNLLPGFLQNIPTNHFYAVNIAFNLLLTLEVLSLIFILPGSVANAMGKQFEILSLILLRQSFKEFVHFTEPIEWTQVATFVPVMLSDALGAVLVFGLLRLFYTLQKHRPITLDAAELANFVTTKKLIALFLLIIFAAIAAYDAWRWLTGGATYQFFEVFYTVLIFSDILLVLISLRYNSTYSVVFRNSGFAVATVLIRLALTAPPFYNVGLGVAAAILSLGLAYIYNNFSLYPPPSEVKNLIIKADGETSSDKK